MSAVLEGASVNVILPPPPAKLYATSGSCITPPTLTSIAELDPTAVFNVKVVVLPSVVNCCFSKKPLTGFAPIYAI